MDEKRLHQKIMEMGGQPLLDLVTEIRNVQRDQADQIASINRNVADLVNGFPDGDVDGHRRYHESVIEWRELRNQLMRAALEKVAQAGALSAVGYILMAFWQWFKLEARK